MLTSTTAEHLLSKYQTQLYQFKNKLSSINRMEDAMHIQRIINGLYAVANPGLIRPNERADHQCFKAFLNHVNTVWELTIGSKEKLTTMIYPFCDDEEKKIFDNFLHEEALIRQIFFFKNLPDPELTTKPVKVVLAVKFPNNNMRSQFLMKVINREFVIYQKIKKNNLCRYYNTPKWNSDTLFMMLRDGHGQAIQIICMDKVKKKIQNSSL